MAKEILVDNGKRIAMMKALNTTYPTIRKALRFKIDSEAAKKIRKVALDEGGRLVEY